VLGLTEDLSVISGKPPTWLNTVNERFYEKVIRVKADMAAVLIFVRYWAKMTLNPARLPKN
jgi:hypothetical protein